MARRGLIAAYPTKRGLEYGLMPFVVGIYEMQLENMDAEMARLFEDYFQDAFSGMLAVKPQFHRVVPVGQSIRSTMEVRPYETAAELVNAARAWAVQDCICRKQKALIGDPCQHPIHDICLSISSRPGTFDHDPSMHPLTQEEALAVLRRAADAGLVHSVSNNQKDVYYICNCCTCSCAILRGMAKLGKANVVASSAFVNRVGRGAVQRVRVVPLHLPVRRLERGRGGARRCRALRGLRRVRAGLPVRGAWAGAPAGRRSARRASNGGGLVYAARSRTPDRRPAKLRHNPANQTCVSAVA